MTSAARDRVRDLEKALRLTRDFPRFVRRPIDAQQASGLIDWRLRTREARFLRLAERAIFQRPSSPYFQLLRAVGCEPGDLRRMVLEDGLEGALARLDRVGVYLTLEEFKGRRAVVRGSVRFSFSENDFDNPDAYPQIEAWTGGTRGPGTSIKMSLPYFSDLAVNTGLAFRAHGLLDYGHALWLQTFTPALIYARLGRPTLAWFHPIRPLPARATLFSRYLTLLGRLSGRPMPRPRFVDLRQPELLASWLAAQGTAGQAVCLTTYASSAVRICVAACAAGLSLERVCFITLGEPFTAAKRRLVEQAGARVLVRYAFTEAGIIGYACATPTGSDDLHFFEDSYGLIACRRMLSESGPAVEALRYTSLLATAPKILLNVESGDTARLERRACGCAIGAAGLHQHLAEVRSFEKLSGEGMTFIKTDLVRLLEEVLPARFGGTAADYQALEEQDEQGILRLVLVVSPRVGPIDEHRLREAFLEGIAQGGGSGPEGAAIWRLAGTLEVRRREPLATRAGKILPFHLVAAPAGPERPDPPTQAAGAAEQG